MSVTNDLMDFGISELQEASGLEMIMTNHINISITEFYIRRSQ